MTLIRALSRMCLSPSLVRPAACQVSIANCFRFELSATPPHLGYLINLRRQGDCDWASAACFHCSRQISHSSYNNNKSNNFISLMQSTRARTAVAEGTATTTTSTTHLAPASLPFAFLRSITRPAYCLSHSCSTRHDRSHNCLLFGGSLSTCGFSLRFFLGFSSSPFLASFFCLVACQARAHLIDYLAGAASILLCFACKYL